MSCSNTSGLSGYEAKNLKFSTDIRAAWIKSLKSEIAYRCQISNILDGITRGIKLMTGHTLSTCFVPRRYGNARVDTLL